MKRQIMMVALKMAGEAIVLTILAGIVVVLIGYWRAWDTSFKYSNAFFIAGCLMFIGGAFSRQAAGQEWSYFQRLSADSFRDMSPGERANFIVEASSSMRLVILGILSGILLILISVLVW
jgi:hypothetical protein